MHIKRVDPNGRHFGLGIPIYLYFGCFYFSCSYAVRCKIEENRNACVQILSEVLENSMQLTRTNVDSGLFLHSVR